MRFNSLHQKNSQKTKNPQVSWSRGSYPPLVPIGAHFINRRGNTILKDKSCDEPEKMVQEDKHSYSVFGICYLFSWRVFFPHVWFSALQLRLPSFLSRSELFPILQKNPSGPTFTFQTQNLHIPNLKVKKIKTLHKYKYYCFLRRIGIFF